MEYKSQNRNEKCSGSEYGPKEVHYWRPPCSCGVELGEAIKEKKSVETKLKGDVHFWRPPCSCGVSLDEAIN